MNKVILTQEQAEAIKLAVADYGSDRVMDGAVKGQWTTDKLTPLNKLYPCELARALYIGYEVEPEYKVGDWIVHKNGNPFNTYLKPLAVKITSVKKDNVYYAEDCNVTYPERIRHATPSEIAKEKERRFFARHGREPWELRLYDAVKRTTTKIPLFVVETSCDHLKNTTSYKLSDGSIQKKENMKELFEVLYFAEQRLDVKNK